MLGNLFFRYEGGGQIDPHPEKTTLKKPSFIRVNLMNINSIYVKKLNPKVIDKPSKINCLLKRRNSAKSFCSFSVQYSTAV